MLTMTIDFDGDPEAQAMAISAILWQYPIPDDYPGTPESWSVGVVANILNELIANYTAFLKQQELDGLVEEARRNALKVETRIPSTEPPPTTE